jgi:hypothetical protein
MTLARFARFRVPAGFACAALAFWLAKPTPLSLLAGLFVGLPGEVVRLWAAGHIDKGREITSSGPYRFVRHPLYLGSAVLGIGFAIASASLAVAGLVALYLVVTLVIAMRTEEAALDEKFEGGYSAWRAGQVPAADRAFSWVRVRANREYRAVIGLVLAGMLLYLRA